MKLVVDIHLIGLDDVYRLIHQIRKKTEELEKALQDLEHATRQLGPQIIDPEKFLGAICDKDPAAQ